MGVREGVTGCLTGLVVVWIGAAATLAIVTAQERPVEVSRKAGFEGTNPDTGEIFRGDVLSGAAKDAFLKAHNDARKKVGLSPVAWSDDIADYALDWIIVNKQSYLAAAREGKLPLLKHRPQDEGKTKQKYGENMACLRGPDSVEASAPTQAVAAWLEEKAAFDNLNAEKPYVVGDETGKTDHKSEQIRVGHYTQIVWKDTQKIGAAMFEVTLNEKRMSVIVCNYDPRGNFLGQKPY